MNANFVTAVPGAAVMTLLIILAMHALIGIQPVALDERERFPFPEFRPQVEERELVADEPPPSRIPDAPEPPPLTPLQDPGPADVGLRIPNHAPPPRLSDKFGISSLPQDGPLVVIVRVQPTYPSGPASRGLEGHVVVEFDVLPDGSVGNVVVLESSNQAFERSAIQAASRFRYKARVVDGEAVLTTGVRYRFRFKMDT